MGRVAHAISGDLSGTKNNRTNSRVGRPRGEGDEEAYRLAGVVGWRTLHKRRKRAPLWTYRLVDPIFWWGVCLRLWTVSSDIPGKIDIGIKTIKLDGDSSPRGEGVMKVWSNFGRYIASENSYGRATVGYGYAIFESQAQLIAKHFREILKDLEPYERNAVHVRYKTRMDYFALGPNCTTVSVDGAQQAVPKIVQGSEAYISTDGILGYDALMGMKYQGYKLPPRVFLPANLGAYLDGAPAIRVEKRTVYQA